MKQLTGSMFSVADKLLEKHGLYVDRDGSGYKKFADQILGAELEIVRRSINIYQGNPRQLRFDRLFADIDADNPPSSSGLTLREVIERYEDDPARRGLTEKHAGVRNCVSAAPGVARREQAGAGHHTGGLPAGARYPLRAAAECQQTFAWVYAEAGGHNR